MRKRPCWDQYFLNLAKAVADRSPDEETQVGCVIVDSSHRLLASGYNGFPPGFPDNELPATRPEKYPFMVHAETNAIASSTQDLRGSILYCTLSPCVDCTKTLITAGVRKIVVSAIYVNADLEHVIKMLKYAQIPMKMVNGSYTEHVVICARGL